MTKKQELKGILQDLKDLHHEMKHYDTGLASDLRAIEHLVEKWEKVLNDE